MPPFNGTRKKMMKILRKILFKYINAKKIQKIIFKYLKNMKTCAPTGATVIGCKCYWVQLVLGSTVFHHLISSMLSILKRDKIITLTKQALEFATSKAKLLQHQNNQTLS